MDDFSFDSLMNNDFEDDYEDDLPRYRSGLSPLLTEEPADQEVSQGAEHDEHNDGYGELEFDDGSVYRGDLVNGVRCGYGIMDYPNGDCYEGFFDNDVFNSSGVSCLKGELRETLCCTDENGKQVPISFFDKSGRGRYTFANGCYIEGYWKDDILVGEAVSTYDDGAVYRGEWHNHCPNGFGRMTYADGTYDEGSWTDGELEGEAVVTYRDGRIYRGEWRNDRPEGSGKLTYPNGESYEGTWKNGSLDGNAVVRLANRSVYRGEWHNNSAHGRGTYVSDEGIYVGQFVRGKKEGTGRMTYSNGEVYEGEWKYNQPHGTGVYTKANGTSFHAWFQNGKLLRTL